jgi:transcriptional regulator with XRE-family HTH domain
MPRLGKILKRARLKQRWSLAQLSEVSGVATVTIYRIECGKTDPRFGSQLVPIVHALGLELADLIHQLHPTPKGNQKGKP